MPTFHPHASKDFSREPAREALALIKAQVSAAQQVEQRFADMRALPDVTKGMAKLESLEKQTRPASP